MLDTMAEVMQTAYARGWITTRDGNVSLRRAVQNCMYITPTGVRKQALSSESMIKLYFPEDPMSPDAWSRMTRADDPYQQRIIGLKPSGELPFHYWLQVNTPTSNRVVLHLHPTHIVAAMYAGMDLQDIVRDFPELENHTTVGPTVGKVQAQSTDLGSAVAQAFGVKSDGSINSHIIGLHMHGVVAVDVDPWLAYGHIERLNHVCEIVLAAGGHRKQNG
jgi:ribulose-5-phosphate 4-epimerase/fuculose-1-phosphate aldolase